MNPAQALHAVLARVQQSDAPTVLGAWQQVLQAEATTSEFVLRHAEVVRLVETIARRLIASASDGVTAEALTMYLPSWYRAVVWQGHWQAAQEPPSGIITIEQMAYLGLFGKHEFAEEEHLTTAGLSTLRSNLDSWIVLLDESTEILAPLRQQIRTQVEHVRWLLDNVDLLGTTPVVRESQTLLGQVASAATAQPLRLFSTQRWKSAFAGLVVLLAGVAGATGEAKIIISNVQQVYSAIENWEQPALPAGESAVRELPAAGVEPMSEK
jgi:hypothetical protein